MWRGKAPPLSLSQPKIKNMRVSKELAQEYFETFVTHQPEDAVKLLMDLFSREVKQEDFITNAANDIADIYY